MSSGHDEYWSGGQRASVEAARDAGVNLTFFSGQEMFWKTRWEPSIDGSATSHRTLVSYKETLNNGKIDPDPAWTGAWRDPRFSAASDGGRPENALTGSGWSVNCCSYAITVPAAMGQARFWRNTASRRSPRAPSPRSRPSPWLRSGTKASITASCRRASSGCRQQPHRLRKKCSTRIDDRPG